MQRPCGRCLPGVFEGQQEDQWSEGKNWTKVEAVARPRKVLDAIVRRMDFLLKVILSATEEIRKYLL